MAADGSRIPLGRADALLRPALPLTQTVCDLDGIRALKDDYEQLGRLTGNTLPFALQEWHLAWCTHFLNRNPRVQQQPLFVVSRDESGASAAIVPLILSRRRVGPLKLGTVDLLGADPGLTEIRNPLVKPGCERLAVRAVHAALADIPGWDWIEWRGISEELSTALACESTPQWCEIMEDYVLDLPASWEEFRASLKRNVREALRHCYNSLRRAGLSFEFIVAREPAEVRRGMERFLQLHTLRAHMRRGPPHPDRFAGRALRNFLYDVCTRLAQRDAVRLFQLRIGGHIVAARLAFVVRDSMYLYYSGFDPAWARYSVMTTATAEGFRYAIAQGLKSANLSLTGEQSKLRWRPRRVEFHSALVHRQFVTSRLACRAYRAALASDGRPSRILKRLWQAHRDWN
jgi:CelD/BcsL family acetyltransferase involved in cellulose biosynthesis